MEVKVNEKLSQLEFLLDNLVGIIYSNESNNTSTTTKEKKEKESEMTVILETEESNSTMDNTILNNSKQQNRSSVLNRKRKLSESKEFFREFRLLDSKILKKIEGISLQNESFTEEEVRKLDYLVEKYKKITLSYQATWEEDYWMMYNSIRNELVEYNKNEKEEVECSSSISDEDLKNIDDYINSLPSSEIIHSEEFINYGKEKERGCCSACVIF